MKLSFHDSLGRSTSKPQEKQQLNVCSSGAHRQKRRSSVRQDSIEYHVSGLSVIGCILLAVSSLACILSLVAPFWLIFPVRSLALQLNRQNITNGVKTKVSTVPPLHNLPPSGSSSLISGLDTNVLPELNSATGVGRQGSMQLPSSVRNGRRSTTARPSASMTGDEWTEGLWAKCVLTDHRCDWFWKNDFAVQRSFQSWHLATQGLFTSGALLLLILFAVASINVCCRCIGQTALFSFVIGSLVIISMALLTSALVVYGVFGSSAYKVQTPWTRPRLYWAFYTGIISISSELAAASLFVCDGRNRRRHYQSTGYRKTTVV